MTELKGTFVVMATPMHADYSIDEAGLRDNVEFYLSQGVHGLMPCGSTGEFASLTFEEWERVVGATVEQAAGRVPVVPGAAAETTARTIEMARRAQALGASGVLTVPPWYSGPGEEELYRHYRALGEALEIPVMIYNNPFASGVDMSPELIARCAQVDNIDYIKESTSDIRRVHALKRLCGDDLTVFCGWDDLVYEFFALDAQGWVCVAGNVVPGRCAQLFEVMVERGDYQRGRELFYQLQDWLEYLEYSGVLVQAVKLGLEIQGRAGGPLRPPRFALTPEQEARVREILAALGVS